jgi:hypothetical protein
MTHLSSAHATRPFWGNSCSGVPARWSSFCLRPRRALTSARFAVERIGILDGRASRMISRQDNGSTQLAGPPLNQRDSPVGAADHHHSSACGYS